MTTAIRTAMQQADRSLADELAEGMRSASEREAEIRATVHRDAAISADRSSLTLRNATEIALRELEGRKAAHLENISAKHEIENNRLKSHAKMLDSRIEEMQHTLASLIEQRGEVDNDIRKERETFSAERKAAEAKYSVLISSQRQVLSSIDSISEIK